MLDKRLGSMEASDWRDAFPGIIWYCRLGRSERESLLSMESRDWVRVCMNGTVGGREISSYGKPDRRRSSSGVDNLFSLSASVLTEDLLFLCFGRAVRWSSSGFISGGIRLIFRNMMPSQVERPSEIK